MLQGACDSTGFSASLLIGGPVPEHQGDIATIRYVFPLQLSVYAIKVITASTLARTPTETPLVRRTTNIKQRL